MKKFLLLTALMAGAMTVNAQSDFQVKELAKLPVANITNYDKKFCRSGFGFGDKFFMTDRTAQQLRVFDLATGKEIAQKEIQKEVQTLGHDEVGNIHPHQRRPHKRGYNQRGWSNQWPWRLFRQSQR